MGEKQLLMRMWNNNNAELGMRNAELTLRYNWVKLNGRTTVVKQIEKGVEKIVRQIVIPNSELRIPN